MKKYRRPDLISYRSRDIVETVGPCQAQSAFMSVGGGWYTISQNSNSTEYVQEIVTSSKIKMLHYRTNTIEEINV